MPPIANYANGCSQEPDQETIARLLWDRFAVEHEVEWPSYDAAEYRGVAAEISALYAIASFQTWRDLLDMLSALVNDLGCTIEQYDKIGPDFTHKDGTEVFHVSVLLDRRELIDGLRADLKALLTRVSGFGGGK